jgi:hypothetical protein
MFRACLHAALVISVFAPAGMVAADDGMCFTMSDTGSSWARIDQSVEVGPFFSSDGSMLSSPAVERVSMQLEREGRLPAGEVLWCWSPDDPRCSPGDPAPEDGPRALRDARTAAFVSHTTRRWPDLEALAPSRAPNDDDRPSDGVRSRVERPPRG